MAFLKNLFYKTHGTTLTVTSNNGFHLRPVAQFVSVAKKYPCKITASFEGTTVDAKGVNTLLALSLEKGSRFKLTCQGKQAKEALKVLRHTFTSLMQEDKEIKAIQKEQSHYKGAFIEGDIISSGIAIAPVYHYKETRVQKKSELTFEEAVHQSIDELEILYTTQAQNSDANIYLAQKELLASLKAKASTLHELEVLIEDASSELAGGKLEAKISDYKDILQRVKKHLGLEVEAHFPDNPFILLANDLLPSQIEQLSQTDVAGVILKETSINSHTAILLRGAGIPSLIADTSLFDAERSVILDAHSSVVVTDPTRADMGKARKRLVEDTEQKALASEKRFKPAVTQKGRDIKVMANVTDIDSVKISKEEGAQGIGLLRTEFLFKEEKPSFERQTRTYEEIFSHFDDITVRTLDVGGDKALPYLKLPKENNPFLGIRGIRLFQSHPEIMAEQLHAIFAAAGNKTIKIMFPMVSSVEEFHEAKTFAKELAKKHQLDISQILFGIMIEVPSVLFLIESFNEVVDFYSIGTNDLGQYLFAIERTHPTLKVDEASPVLFNVIDTIVKKATKPVSICGELAANKKAIATLINLGIETLSVSPKSIAQTKEEIRHV